MIKFFITGYLFIFALQKILRRLKLAQSNILLSLATNDKADVINDLASNVCIFPTFCFQVFHGNFSGIILDDIGIFRFVSNSSCVGAIFILVVQVSKIVLGRSCVG